jgi:hypothetical protein
VIFRALLSTFIFFSIIFYCIYVIFVSEPCARIERATKPVYLAGIVVQEIAEPWSSPSTMKWLEQQTFKLQLRTALVLRKQFYSKSETPVICDWDAYADLVGGTPMTKTSKKAESKESEEAKQQSKESEEAKQQSKEQREAPAQESKNLDLPPLPLD